VAWLWIFVRQEMSETYRTDLDMITCLFNVWVFIGALLLLGRKIGNRIFSLTCQYWFWERHSYQLPPTPGWYQTGLIILLGRDIPMGNLLGFRFFTSLKIFL